MIHNNNDYCPSLKQIRCLCKQIQKSWTEYDRKMRSGLIRAWDGARWYFPSEFWIVPQFSPKFLYLERKSKKKNDKSVETIN